MVQRETVIDLKLMSDLQGRPGHYSEFLPHNFPGLSYHLSSFKYSSMFSFSLSLHSFTIHGHSYFWCPLSVMIAYSFRMRNSHNIYLSYQGNICRIMWIYEWIYECGIKWNLEKCIFPFQSNSSKFNCSIICLQAISIMPFSVNSFSIQNALPKLKRFHPCWLCSIYLSVHFVLFTLFYLSSYFISRFYVI